MRYLVGFLIVSLLFVLSACTGGDIDPHIDLYQYSGEDEGQLVIDPDDFEIEYRFDVTPRNAFAECRYSDDDWFDCESPHFLNQDSEELDIEEGYLSFDVRAYDEDQASSSDNATLLLLYDFDFALDDAEEHDPGAADPAFHFPGEYSASCDRSDCELNCFWEADGLDSDDADADCSLDGDFDVEFPDDDLENATFNIEACATNFGGDQDDEHCKAAKSYLFYPAPETWEHLSSGTSHTCGIVEDGSLWCWGRNNAGQVGIGDSDASTAVPQEVDSTVSQWHDVAAGDEHTCAIDADGALYCWGDESQGQLGSDDIIDNTKPEKVDDGPWDTVTAGGQHSCAVTDEGGLFCWGANFFGQLGTEDESQRSEPASISLPSGKQFWTDVYAGEEHTCGIADASGAVARGYCWGRASDGRLGNDSTSGNFTEPDEVDITGSFGFLSMSAGPAHTCAILEVSGNNRTYCWGGGSSGQLGVGGNSDLSFPDEVSNGRGYSTVTAGEDHTCGIDGDGAAHCWGRNQSGQLGDGGDESQVNEPLEVDAPDGKGFSAVTAGSEFSCGIAEDGVAYCWGTGNHGRLGDGTTGGEQSSPHPVSWPQGRLIPTPGDDE